MNPGGDHVPDDEPGNAALHEMRRQLERVHAETRR